MADPIFKSLVAFALFASLLLCSSLADASSDVPFILAHKKATLNRLKSGAERVSVTIDIYNQGTSLMSLFLMEPSPELLYLTMLQQVTLVGHDFGGACISYAMELFPLKISKSVFVSATMLISAQSTLDIFSQQEGSNDLLQRAQIYLSSNGKYQPPSSIDLDKSLLRDLLFNQSPAKLLPARSKPKTLKMKGQTQSHDVL